MILPVIEVRGGNRSSGEQFGEACREEIGAFHDALMENVMKRYSLPMGPGELERLVSRHIAASAVFAPHLVEEMEGIAAGARVPLRHIHFLNAFLDLVTGRDPGRAVAAAGCTAFACEPAATVDGHTYVGQNYDMEAFYEPFGLVLVRHPTSEPTTALFTFPGVLGCAGANSAGIGVSINFLHAADASIGVLYPCVVRRILEGRTLGWAVGSATVAVRASGMHYTLGSSEGVVVGLETTAMRHDVLLPTEGTLVHTNHYLSASLADSDVLFRIPGATSSVERRGSSFMRWLVASRRLTADSGSITQEGLLNMCSDHQNDPFGTCFHGQGDDDMLRGQTVATLNFDLTENTAVFRRGMPCAGHPAVRIELPT